MLIVTIVRPNTVGETYRKEYDSYKDAETWIERQCEKLADKGWDLYEPKESNSTSGFIECTHDDIADSMLIKWNTIVECTDNECDC